MITRRGLLAGILGACAAPAIVHNPMRIWVPRPIGESISGIWTQRLAEKFWQMDMEEALNASFPPLIISPSIARMVLDASPADLAAAGVTLRRGEVGRIDDGFSIGSVGGFEIHEARQLAPPRPAIKRPHRRW